MDTSIKDNLDSLETQIRTVKNRFAVNLGNKGVTGITENSTLTAMADSVTGITASEPTLEEKTIEIIENGTTTITPSDGNDGISKATINVNVPQSGGNEPTEHYLISPEELVKCHDTGSDEYRKKVWTDNGEFCLLDKENICFDQPWNMSYYDTNSSSYVQEYKPSGSEYTTYSSELVREFKDYFNKGYKICDRYDSDKTIDNVEVNSSWVNTQSDSDYYDKQVDIKYYTDGEYSFYKQGDYGLEIAPLVNPLNGNEYYFKLCFKPQGYYNIIEYNTSSPSHLSIDGGANLALSYPFECSVVGNELIVDMGMYYSNTINGKYFNIFYGNDYYKDVVFEARAMIFKSGLKKITLIDNHNMPLYNTFRNNKDVCEIDLSRMKTCEDVDFSDCHNLRKIITGEVIPIISGSNPIFNNCYNLTSIPQLDTSKVTSMGSMFSSCSSLITIPQLDTSNVTYMDRMFDSCINLTTIPQLDTRNVTNMNYMFYGCTSLTEIPQLDTRNVTIMNNMFEECSSLTSIPQLDVTNVTNMDYMLTYCYKLRKIELKGFGTQQNIRLNYSFGYSWGPIRTLGIDGDGITGCKEALLNTFLTNSFDRTAAGYSPLEFTLSKETWGIFTPEEQAAITAKGYTITTA